MHCNYCGHKMLKVLGGKGESWTMQTNIGRWLCHKNGIEVESIQVVVILRDWSKLEAKRDRYYPQFQVVVFDIPVWTMEESEQFITARVAAIEEAKTELPLCSREERWAKPDKWAVMKNNRVRAIKLHDNPEDADDHANSLPELYVQWRPGEDVRCQHYCRAAPKCEQFQSTQKHI